MSYCHVRQHGWILRVSHAKCDKSDRNGQESYDFTRVWGIKLKATNEHTKHLQMQTCAWWLPERVEVEGGKWMSGVSCVETEGDLTSEGEHMVQCIDGVSWNCTLDTYHLSVWFSLNCTHSTALILVLKVFFRKLEIATVCRVLNCCFTQLRIHPLFLLRKTSALTHKFSQCCSLFQHLLLTRKVV